MSDATLIEDPQVDTSVATAPDEGASGVAEGPCCEKCGLVTKATACPRCGWYPSLGIHVEIDEAFEAAMNNLPAETPAEGAEAPSPKPDLLKHLEVWRGLIPGWGWLMLGTTMGCIGAAVAARIATLGSPTAQMWCGVGGLVGGLAVLATAHLVAFLLCSFEDADFGVADILVKPLKSWKRIASELPHRVWIANCGNLGASLALSAALIVGGVPYERLLDWGIKAQPKATLIGAITSAAEASGDGPDNLEDAVGDFAGDAGVDKLGASDAATPEPAKPREKLECLIIGYQVGGGGKIQSFLLAAEAYGKLKFVGRVTPELDDDQQRALLAKFAKNESTRPLVKTTESGLWLRPRFTCRVTYTEWPQGRRPKDLAWDEMLDEVKLPW